MHRGNDMNKKGFIIIETIVVLIVVVVSLTLVLSSYSLVISRSKSKEYYNRPNDIYLLYYLSEYIGESKISGDSFYSTLTNENDNDLLFSSQNIYSAFKNIYHINSIAKINDKNDLSSIEFSNINNSMKEYIKQLNDNTEYLIIEINAENNDYYYASVKVGEYYE